MQAIKTDRKPYDNLTYNLTNFWRYAELLVAAVENQSNYDGFQTTLKAAGLNGMPAHSPQMPYPLRFLIMPCGHTANSLYPVFVAEAAARGIKEITFDTGDFLNIKLPDFELPDYTIIPQENPVWHCAECDQPIGNHDGDIIETNDELKAYLDTESRVKTQLAIEVLRNIQRKMNEQSMSPEGEKNYVWAALTPVQALLHHLLNK